MDIGAKQESLVHPLTGIDPPLTPLSVAIVGVGRWGRNLLRVARNTVGVRLTGVVEPADVGDLGVPLAPDVGGLIREVRPDAVILASPSEVHYEQARQALMSGCHVFVEKPLALRSSDARELCTLAREHRRTLMVGHILRYHPGISAVRALVDGGEFGAPVRVSSARMVERASEENPWWCLAPHDLSLVEHLAGAPIDNVRCWGVGNSARAQYRCANGVTGDVRVAFEAPKNSWVRVTCEGGEIRFVGNDSRVTVRIRGRTVTVGVAPLEPLALEFMHFVSCIRTGQAPKTDGPDGLAVVQALEAGDRSWARGGKWEPVC